MKEILLRLSLAPRYSCENRQDSFQYRCDTCEIPVFETFPEDLSYMTEFLTKMVADLPESWREELLTKRKKEMKLAEKKRKNK